MRHLVVMVVPQHLGIHRVDRAARLTLHRGNSAIRTHCRILVIEVTPRHNTRAIRLNRTWNRRATPLAKPKAQTEAAAIAVNFLSRIDDPFIDTIVIDTNRNGENPHAPSETIVRVTIFSIHSPYYEKRESEVPR